MKKIFFLVALAFVVLSCNNGNKVETQYKIHMSHNKAYEVEIPVDYTEERSIGDFMSFRQGNTRTFVSIQSLKADESLANYAYKFIHGGDGNNFVYSPFEQTDTTCFYKVTRGTAMWSAYTLFMTKKLNDIQYVIYISSDTKSKESLVELINHIQGSLVSHSQDIKIIDSEKSDNKKDGNFTCRETNYYSIEYPKEWKIILNPDQMSDVYIGDSEGKLGFTILFFDTDYSLAEINKEGDSNMKAAGAKVVSNQKITINNQSCYKSIYEFSVGNMDVEQISYTFKKGETMYNVNFGNSKKEVEANMDMINKIVGTFKIK